MSYTPSPGLKEVVEGWAGLSLYAKGNRWREIDPGPGIEDFEPTELLDKSPYLRTALGWFECPMRMAGLFTLYPGGVIKPHRDEGYGFDRGIIRLHVPITTDPRVLMIIGGERQIWLPGQLWFGDFAQEHSVENDTRITRVHLVLDVIVNDFVKRLFPKSFLKIAIAGTAPVHRDTIPVATATLARYRCHFSLPDGAPDVEELKPNADYHTDVFENSLVIFEGAVPRYALDPVGNHQFFFRAGDPALVLQFDACPPEALSIRLERSWESRIIQARLRHRGHRRAK